MQNNPKRLRQYPILLSFELNYLIISISYYQYIIYHLGYSQIFSPKVPGSFYFFLPTKGGPIEPPLTARVPTQVLPGSVGSGGPGKPGYSLPFFQRWAFGPPRHQGSAF